MNTDRLTTALPALRRSAAPAAALVLILLVVWALSGAGYFWPMWPYWALLVLTGLLVVSGQLQAWCLAALAFTALWGMSGGGYFWAAWPMLGIGIACALPLLRRAPRERVLEERVDELSRTRRGALDVQATELRRIERDLHDGAQARLVALSMQLGRAEERLHGDPDAQALVAQARREATAAIGELRDLARGIAPPVLADRGLEAAVQSLADRSGATVTVNAELPQRLPPAVELSAYFVVAEALTNAAKHADAPHTRVTLWADHAELGIVVADDGVGGADPLGGGLSGLRQRVEALDGWLRVDSPVGEGTTVRAGLPCG
jgi:signal transduction histidine kinase